MKKTDTLIKAISILALIAIICYIGWYIYEASTNPLRTAAAVENTVRDSAPTKGWIVRSEELLTGDVSRTAVSVSEGEKLAKGGTYARRFSSQESMETMEEVHALEVKIDWLSTLAEEGDGAADRMSRESVAALSYGIDHSGGIELAELIDDVKVKVFGSEDFTHESIVNRLNETRDELDRVNSTLNITMDQLKTDKPGIFSSYTDGFENVSPADIGGISPEKLSDLFDTAETVDDNVIGKLVTDIRWRYAAIMTEKDAAKLREGTSYSLEFTDTYDDTVVMEAEMICPAEGGKAVVIFVTDRNLKETLGVRELTADIVFNRTTGMRIPKEAVYVDEDGQNYVYIISGIQAERVDIEILSDYDEYYLVKSEGDLRSGMEVIVEAKDLYSGKVVRE